MLQKFWFWFLGDKWGSSVGGVVLGALVGAAVAAAAGNLDATSLIASAAGGAASAMTGVAGRKYGEK